MSTKEVIAEALYPYSAAEGNQISLQLHEKIWVLEKDKSGWWIGKRQGTGEVGVFPSTYVRVLEDKFNRPKEQKQIQAVSQPSSRPRAQDKEREWKAELGFDSDSDDAKGAPDERNSRLRTENLHLRKSLENLTTEHSRTREKLSRCDKERLKAANDVQMITTQMNILKKQLATTHEKERRMQLELEDWKALASENGADPPAPRQYIDEPDEALSRWLNAATQEKLKESNEKIAKLQNLCDQLMANERRSETPMDDEGEVDLPATGDSPKPEEKKKTESQKNDKSDSNEGGPAQLTVETTRDTPSPVPPGTRPDKHDSVKLADAHADWEGCLKPGEIGTVVEDQGQDSPIPFRVRNAKGEDTWYAEEALVVVAMGKRKKESKSPVTSPKESSASASPALKEEIKEKNKKIKKLERKQQVLEEDLQALEKYNTKLEKRLEKEKAKVKSAASPSPSSEKVEALEAEIAKLQEEKKNTPAPVEVAVPTTADSEETLQKLQKAIEESQLLSTEKEQAIQDATRAKEEKEAIMDRLKELESSDSVLQSEVTDTKQQLEKRTVELEDQLKKISGLEQEAIAAKEDAAAAREISNKLETEMSSFSKERDNLINRTAAAEKQLSENNEQLGIAVEKYKKEERRRRELYNQLMELKGNIRVYCRLKPCSSDETNECISLDDDMTMLIKDPTAGKQMLYEFDKCFGEDATQLEIFEEAKGLAISVLDGYYVCIFAYGQTGSGKTYTMEGPPENRGVNFRTVSELFKVCEERTEDYKYELSVSVLEVYNDKIFDLQNKRSPVKVTPAPKGERDVIIQPLKTEPVTSTDQVIDALAKAYVQRKVAGTSMNQHSSRSHCILTVYVKGENVHTGKSLTGKLHLVDLAGSERLKQSEVEGEQLLEATHINKSLTQLGLCINSLANKKDHIPFRNSQLTTLLQDSLGGNCKCLMFANISPLSSNVPETISTMKFATNARKVELGKASKNVK
eukprot:TRINITY_DN4865_c0_g3_i2.p1 TRINITY_DN4865_c0_g3~~TRINITY_DN4865_c0_g3_i2.p1  ORF type:complete len:975 (+),score=306.90 TRINITY_DN4865_c0_g3_i2:85-3009(+)